ncbi:hypothetical protein MMC25_006981 [Agyrium rufum]|nr:hypothetical protein [Agyrium rufum]
MVYNPQLWGQMSGSSSVRGNTQRNTAQRPSETTQYANRLRGPDEPVASPPPPYSPRPSNDSTHVGSSQQHLEHRTLHRLTSLSPSSQSPTEHFSASPTQSRSPDSQSPFRYIDIPSSQSRQHNQNGTAFPPPPNEALPRQRHTDRLLAAMKGHRRDAQVPSPGTEVHTSQNSGRSANALPQTTDVTLPRPPASRRAASAGAIGYHASSFLHVQQRQDSRDWEHGTVMPPPPPGPPPGGSRSQSLCRPHETPNRYSNQDQLRAPFRHRHQPGQGTHLETIPPTPANWTDETVEAENPAAEGTSVPLDGARPSTRQSQQPKRDSSVGSLFRSPAVRNRSAKGIRERRSESRNGKAPTEDTNVVADHYYDLTSSLLKGNVTPSNLVLGVHEGNLSKRRASTRMSPAGVASPGSMDAILCQKPLSTSELAPASASNKYSLQQGGVGSAKVAENIAATKHSLVRENVVAHLTVSNPSRGSIKAILEGRSDGQQRSVGLDAPHNQPADRPISHLLHIPNSELAIDVLPLSPDESRSTPSAKDDTLSDFAQKCRERHKASLADEVQANSHSEGLRVFACHMMEELHHRGSRYTDISAEQRETLAEMSTQMSQLIDQLTGTVASPAHRASFPLSSRQSTETSYSTNDNVDDSTSMTSDYELSIDTLSPLKSAGEAQRWNDFVPCLSPIASMSIVTGRDEMDSRGRAPSRWWESESHGSDQGDGFKVLERSKRESKYMGLNPELRNSPALIEATVFGSSFQSRFERLQAESSTQPTFYADNEYPPEKVGFSDALKTSMTSPSLNTPLAAPFTPDPRKLEISRLVTLPPPYPRHHPAVNNNHPELSSMRGKLRSLSDVEPLNKIRQDYQEKAQEAELQNEEACKRHISQLSHSQQEGYTLSETAGKTDCPMIGEPDSTILKFHREMLQTKFDLYQAVVVGPLHQLLSDRITQVTTCFDDLVLQLTSDAQSNSPNLPQEEGDEQPELLEKLTLLKWLFEARESLHRDIYEVLNDRNDMYKAIVLIPYEQTKNQSKLQDAQAFFEEDAKNRRALHNDAILTRHDSFLATVNQHVTRGVELQMGAFWDIAPDLLDLLQRVPAQDPCGFEILIPKEEVEENEVYWQHPLKYLYSLVIHAEASSRQFIDSQIALWCLLQEIREARAGAYEKVKGKRRPQSWRTETQLEQERKALIDDLKEKVATVESQWIEGLGGVFGRVKEGVKEWLIETGGWSDDDED